MDYPPVEMPEQGVPAFAVDAAKETLLQMRPDLRSHELVVKSVEAVDWNDTSLGYPEEGYGYAQVITPGYRVEFQAEEEHFSAHTNAKATRVEIRALEQKPN